MWVRSVKVHRNSFAIVAAGSMVLIALGLGACSGNPDASKTSRTGSRANGTGTAGIVPCPAYSYHELCLGSDVSAVAFDGFKDDRKETLVVWSVNGQNVQTGPTLDSSYLSPGDRVTATINEPDGSGGWREIEHYETVVRDCAPQVESVTLASDPTTPYLVHANVRAKDADGQDLRFHYRWFVDGTLREGEDSPQLQLDASAVGASVVVEVTASDGELQSIPRHSPALRLSSPSVFLKVAGQAKVRELDGGAREYLLAIEVPPEATVQLIGAPSSVRLDAGTLIWKPGKGEKELRMRLRVETSDGSSAEQGITLRL